MLRNTNFAHWTHFNEVSKLTGRCQTRKRSIALRPNSRNSAPSLLIIPGFKIRFDAFDLTKFYEGITRTLSHTLFTVSYQQSAHPRFAVCLAKGRGL